MCQLVRSEPPVPAQPEGSGPRTRCGLMTKRGRVCGKPFAVAGTASAWVEGCPPGATAGSEGAEGIQADNENIGGNDVDGRNGTAQGEGRKMLAVAAAPRS